MNKAALGMAGAVQRVLTSMRHHVSDEGVQKEGCCAIYVLAADEANRGAIESHGAFEIVCEALKNFAYHEEVCPWAKRALFRIAVQDGGK